MTDVPVYVNKQSFVDRGYDGDDVTTAAINAVSVWYEEGQSGLRLYYAGETTDPPQVNRITIRMEDWIGIDDPAWCGTLAWATIPSGDCNAGAYVAIFDQVNLITQPCDNRPINWATHGYPSREYLSMQSVMTHEVGHNLGFLDDYSNPNTVMQSQANGQTRSSHLYKIDISLLRDGVGGQYAQGARTSNTLKNKYSSSLVNWYPLMTNIGTTNLTPGVTSSGSDYVVAFVDGQTQYIKVRKGNGYFSDTPVTLPDKSHIGVALARGSSYYVLAFIEDADARRIGIKRSGNGVSWGATTYLPTSVNSRQPPALAKTQTANQLVLIWSDGTKSDSTMDMLLYSISNDDGATWSTATVLQSDVPEFRSFTGPSISCKPSANECVMVWGSWGTYRAIWPGGSLCAASFTVSGSTSLSLKDVRCGGPTSRGSLPDQVINTGRTPGIAYGSTGSYTGWAMVRAGRDGATTMNTQRRAAFNLDTEWDSPVVHAESLRAGAAMVFSTGWTEWEVFYVSP